MAITKVTRNLLSTGIDDQSNATAITITSAENVGIGTTSPSAILEVSGGSADYDPSATGTGLFHVKGGATSEYSGYIGISDAGMSLGHNGGGSRYLRFDTNETERMRILSDGEIVSGPQALVDTYSPLVNGLTSDALVVGRSATQGSLGLWRSNTNEFKFYHNAYGYIMTFASNGVISGDFNDTSDRNLKENITDLSGGLSVINQLQPRNFDWKKEEKANGVAGFIAQEVEEILPNEVFGNDYVETESDHPDDVPPDNGKHLNYNGILAHAVKAIQEQQTMIEDLQARIETLENA